MCNLVHWHVSSISLSGYMSGCECEQMLYPEKSLVLRVARLGYSDHGPRIQWVVGKINKNANNRCV